MQQHLQQQFLEEPSLSSSLVFAAFFGTPFCHTWECDDPAVASTTEAAFCLVLLFAGFLTHKKELVPSGHTLT